MLSANASAVFVSTRKSIRESAGSPDSTVPPAPRNSEPNGDLYFTFVVEHILGQLYECLTHDFVSRKLYVIDKYCTTASQHINECDTNHISNISMLSLWSAITKF